MDWTDAANTAMGGAMGLITGAISTNQNKKAQERSYRLNEKAADNAQRRAMEMWEATNLSAQRRQMEKAGLNPALMMSQGGNQPSTQGAQGGTSGGGSGDYSMTGTATAMGLLGAQIANINADTELKKTQAGLGGEQTEGAKLANEQLRKTMDNLVEGIKAETDEKQSQARIKLQEANASERTIESAVKRIQAEAENEAFKRVLMESTVSTNEAQKTKWKAEVQQNWEKIEQDWEKLSIELDKVGIAKMQNAIQEFRAKWEVRLGLKNLDMRKLEAGIQATKGLLQKGTTIDKSGSTTTNNNY
jgi:hypothetical protein